MSFEIDFEKTKDIHAEERLNAIADKIWTEKLSASSIREERFTKIKKHVSYSSFVEDSKLNVEKLSEAIDAEIKEWEGLENSEILGFSYSSKEDAQLASAKLTKAEKEDDKAVDEFLAMAGDTKALKTAA